jgi:hypothetical protein
VSNDNQITEMLRHGACTLLAPPQRPSRVSSPSIARRFRPDSVKNAPHDAHCVPRSDGTAPALEIESNSVENPGGSLKSCYTPAPWRGRKALYQGGTSKSLILLVKPA